MASPSKTLKNVHRKQASDTPLKTFAQSIAKDKQHRDTVTAWHANKKAQGKKRKAPGKPKEPAAPAPAKGSVLKKR